AAAGRARRRGALARRRRSRSQLWLRGKHPRCLGHGHMRRACGYSLIKSTNNAEKGTAMTTFPPLNHVALTVRDLSGIVPGYERPSAPTPVIDEDTAPDSHHTVHLLGNGPLFGLHQHKTPAPAERFSEFRIGLDHVSFGVEDRAELEKWARRLDEMGI